MPRRKNQETQFQKQDCELTLGQGLEEFYALNACKFSQPVPDTKWGKLMAAHDACHVLFGVNTTLVEEAYGDMWTMCATTMKFKDFTEFGENDEARDLLQEIGLMNLIMGWLKSLPGIFNIFLRSRKMTKKWAIWQFENRLNDRLVDLRKEHNLKILNA